MAVVIAPGSGGTLATTKLQNAKSGWLASGGDATVHVTLLSIEKVINIRLDQTTKNVDSLRNSSPPGMEQAG